MTCANWILAIAAVLVFAFGVWPWMNIWVVGICAIVIFIVALTGVGCKYCQKDAKAVAPASVPVAKKAAKKAMKKRK